MVSKQVRVEKKGRAELQAKVEAKFLAHQAGASAPGDTERVNQTACLLLVVCFEQHSQACAGGRISVSHNAYMVDGSIEKVER